MRGKNYETRKNRKEGMFYMEEKMKEIVRKIEELRGMIEDSYEDIEAEPLTPLDKAIEEQYNQIWQEVLKICQDEKVKDMDKFDEKYPIFQYGIFHFIENYTNMLDYCVQMDELYLEREIKFLKEIIAQFRLEQPIKADYELVIIRDTYFMGNEKEAEREIDKWIKAYPAIGEGYEVKCNFELEKENPDMEKVAEILDEAEDNDTYVPDDEIYERVIQYYEEIENEEMVDYYTSLLEFKQEEDMFDVENFLDEKRQ